MKRLPVVGCGCLSGLALLVLCAPLLLVGGSGAEASGGPAHVVAGGGSCSAAVGCQQVPAELIGIPLGFFPDPFTNPPGECTSWAAALWPGHHGRGVTWSGDAWSWYEHAAAAGYAVSATPSIGAIAVFARNAGPNGGAGHVAVVLTVAATFVVVTEMNWVGRFVVDTRTVPMSAAGLSGFGFIPVPADAWS